MEWQSLTKIVTGVNIALILGLLYVYVKNMSKIRSIFTTGLVLFAALFLVQNVFMFYFSVTMMPLYVEDVSPHIFVFSILQTCAFVALNWITWK